MLFYKFPPFNSKQLRDLDMPKNDFFRSSSVTTAGIPGGATATVSGLGGGLSQSALAAQKQVLYFPQTVVSVIRYSTH